MKQSIISNSYFHNEEAAYEFIESRLWPDGPVCPHCGNKERISKMNGKSTRIGTYKCYACRKPFTVKIGTIFEDSHIPLRYWLQAIYLMCASKKGISTNQLQRTLGVTIKTAWFLSHRIRLAMTDSGTLEKMKGIVEADETYVGGKRKGSGIVGRSLKSNKTPVFSLLERGGNVYSQPVERVTSKNLKRIIKKNVDKSAIMMTDDFTSYRGLKKDFADHKVIRHYEKKYVDGNTHTNTVEGYFSILKRGINGIYHHVAKHHLHRYLAEFDFRYNHRVTKGTNDVTRVDKVLDSVIGKRLTYQTTH
jgi:transposase-like protein